MKSKSFEYNNQIMKKKQMDGKELQIKKQFM